MSNRIGVPQLQQEILYILSQPRVIKMEIESLSVNTGIIPDTMIQEYNSSGQPSINQTILVIQDIINSLQSMWSIFSATAQGYTTLNNEYNTFISSPYVTLNTQVNTDTSNITTNTNSITALQTRAT